MFSTRPALLRHAIVASRLIRSCAMELCDTIRIMEQFLKHSRKSQETLSYLSDVSQSPLASPLD